MPSLIRILLLELKNIGILLAGIFGANAVGWSIGTVVTVSFIALWVGVLEYSFSYITDALATAASGGQVFGVSLPAGGVYLIEAAFPLSLLFSLVLTFIVFRLTIAKLLVLAIAASRYLKGK